MTIADSVCTPPKEQKFRGHNQLAFQEYLYADKLMGSLVFKNKK